MYIYIQMYIYTYAYIYLSIPMYMGMYTSIHLNICLYVYIYVHVYNICVYVYIYNVYIYIWTLGSNVGINHILGALEREFLGKVQTSFRSLSFSIWVGLSCEKGPCGLVLSRRSCNESCSTRLTSL